MGNQPLVCGKFIGEKKAGETRALRNANHEELISNYQGMETVKDIFNKNTKENPNKKYLGTR
jgi:hypothetical protein